MLMIYSMTSFGKSSFRIDNAVINVEIKSVNSKNCDINIRLPYIYNEKEIEFRNLISSKLLRGKISCFIDIESNDSKTAHEINEAVAMRYFKQLKSINDSLNIKDYNNYLSDLLHLPEVLSPPNIEINEEEYQAIKSALNLALDAAIESRKEEASALEIDFRKRIDLIKDLLSQVEKFEAERITNIENRLKSSLKQIADNVEFDKNRLEQELVYYIEKFDVTEEKVRLAKHCDYFIQTMDENEVAKGRKLGFISQEMGREINTLGSKANSVDLQKIVVQMKDELEKIKEQLLNIL